MSDSLYNSQGIVNQIDWQQYIYLVRNEALKLAVRLPTTIELDDLLQVGYIGLLETIKRYDASQGYSFTTFAVPRIKGAMLDELRSRDWLPRQTRKKIKEVTNAINELEKKLGVTPNDHQIAAYLQLSLTEYRKVLLDTNYSQILSYDEIQKKSGDNFDALIESGTDNNPFSSIISDEIRHIIIQQIDKLPEKEKMVLALYYQEELNLKEIGNVMNISESRVSQLHSQAIKRIQSKITL
ncbi:RNA polymerase sigma factor FliA [Gilliamella sp. B2776]|uniref:RNA polymerase sigma factor FliA n=1 Tax=unclassified Gilliamella TaxID=2685620 RepID=UPI00226AB9E4|nr:MULTISPECIES: RNA polymerase sigma factor FliA [unclassified Gilliamella]MCX8650882.1 RNA polymerase sigma factor FliA [Gilliamella sp. B2779]MCX8654135.1 RNA polymerase sigma factor FliA [Gilliamella sp. B2737]MCX8657215.1 RNA polymerase sigma factor FliA [Gilliamella sp. B2894]MCX8665862.1 RNA polymerase sigma factor FliA [Gilliamella sp. B2887]MCX8692702.1 RNA polymerase sigma factor FliA [Gilliamella sp. B2776]